jgi:hypothetical protein
MNNIYKLLDKPKGLFYNHETFLMSNYIDKWGEYMLNCDAQVLTIKNLLIATKILMSTYLLDLMEMVKN